MGRKRLVQKVEVPKFLTHIPLSKTRYKKINGQSLYAGLNPHIRAKLMRELHDYLAKFMQDIQPLKPPIRIRVEFHAPLNFGSVRRVVDKKTGQPKIHWNPPGPNEKPAWDTDNQWIWTKAFNDTLVALGLVPDDTVEYIVASGEIEFHQVAHIDDRKLVFIIESSL